AARAQELQGLAPSAPEVDDPAAFPELGDARTEALTDDLLGAPEAVLEGGVVPLDPIDALANRSRRPHGLRDPLRPPRPLAIGDPPQELAHPPLERAHAQIGHRLT